MDRTGIIRVACLSATLVVTGCGEAVFKRGADPGAMANTQAACRAATQDEAGYIACMEGKGYLVKGSQDSVFVAGPGTAGGGTQALGDALFEPGTASTTAAATAMAAPAPAPTTAPVTPFDPLKQLDVASWWKLGGSPDQITAAQSRCVGTLGNAHRPDPGGTRVMRAMIGCLQAAGWRGIGR